MIPSGTRHWQQRASGPLFGVSSGTRCCPRRRPAAIDHGSINGYRRHRSRRGGRGPDDDIRRSQSTSAPDDRCHPVLREPTVQIGQKFLSRSIAAQPCRLQVDGRPNCAASNRRPGTALGDGPAAGRRGTCATHARHHPPFRCAVMALEPGDLLVPTLSGARCGRVGVGLAISSQSPRLGGGRILLVMSSMRPRSPCAPGADGTPCQRRGSPGPSLGGGGVGARAPDGDDSLLVQPPSGWVAGTRPGLSNHHATSCLL